jgi:23S rRNA (adenine2503-C2)-methyltransferase
VDILNMTGRPELAQVYVARLRNDPDCLVEFVDACDRSIGDRRQKWVIIVSSQLGCPVRCLMCDAGGHYRGNLSHDELKGQIEAVLAAHQDLDPQACPKLKVQFARMGEPSLNDDVLTTIEWLADEYPNVIPCLATIVPAGREAWFERLLKVRDRFRDFQLQLSINSSDPKTRDRLMPYPKMPLAWVAEFGWRFFRPGQRRPILNFALCPDVPVQADAIRTIFDPRFFAVKLTPLNPTRTGEANQMPVTEERQVLDHELGVKAREFEALGFPVILSIGDLEENQIGSNCGQAVNRWLSGGAG